jgi:hypothetical protein
MNHTIIIDLTTDAKYWQTLMKYNVVPRSSHLIRKLRESSFIFHTSNSELNCSNFHCYSFLVITWFTAPAICWILSTDTRHQLFKNIIHLQYENICLSFNSRLEFSHSSGRTAFEDYPHWRLVDHCPLLWRGSTATNQTSFHVDDLWSMCISIKTDSCRRKFLRMSTD